MILSSKPLINNRIESLKNEVETLKKKGVIPNLKVILVGGHEASIIYTKNKKKFSEKIGVDCEIVTLDENIEISDFLNEVKKYNNDDKVHGILIQLPLPKHLQELKIESLVSPHKDVDGFHPENIYQVVSGRTNEQTMFPCTPKGIEKLLDFYDIEISGKNIVVIGRSMIVGKPMSHIFLNRNATVTICHSKTKDIKQKAKNADIVVCAIGSSEFFNEEYFNNNSVVVDVGMGRKKDGSLCGDVEFEKVSKLVKAITPVPGGVGPTTILMIIENLINQIKNK